MRVEETLAAELSQYRRQIQVHDALRSLDASRLWDGWAARDASASETLLSCAVCGAPHPHRPGQVDGRCGHCGAAVTVTVAYEAARIAQLLRGLGRVQRPSGPSSELDVGGEGKQ